MKREAYEELTGRRRPSNVTYVDLDDPSNQVPPERKTHGQTDAQIRAQSLESLTQRVASSQKVIESLQNHLRDANKQLEISMALRKRRLELGD